MIYFISITEINSSQYTKMLIFLLSFRNSCIYRGISTLIKAILIYRALGGRCWHFMLLSTLGKTGLCKLHFILLPKPLLFVVVSRASVVEISTSHHLTRSVMILNPVLYF